MFKINQIKDKNSKVYKNNKLNTANFANFTHNDYQVFLHLVSMIGGSGSFGKYLQPEELKRKHILSANEFSRVFNIEINNSYKALKKAVDKLMRADIKIEQLEDYKITRVNICSMAEYNKKKGNVTIEFTDRIMPYLAQVRQKFVLYNLKELGNFSSLYTTRLYELIQEFKETGWMLKSVGRLRESFAVGEKLKLYANFKKYTFAHACKEINNNYSMDLRFEEIKEGRKVVAVKFFFKKTKVKKITDKLGNTRSIYEKLKLNKTKLEQKTEVKVSVDQRLFSYNQVKLKVEYPEKPKNKTLLSTILKFFGKE